MPTSGSAKREALFSLLILSLVVIAAPAARAQDEGAALQRAVTLFEAGDYLAAQEVLVAIDRSKLTPSQQETRDDYLSRVQTALTQSEKALRDLEDAETAIEEKEFAKAQQLLAAVLANEYAPASVLTAASAHQRKLAEQGAAPAGQESAGVEAAIIAAAQDAPPPAPAVPVPSEEDTARARALSREAQDMMQAGRYNEAERLFYQALDAVPGYPEAIDGLRQLSMTEEVTAGNRAQEMLDRLRLEDQIRWQRTVAEYRDVERQIRDHVANAEFAEASAALIRARQIVEAGRPYADPIEKYESLRVEVDMLADFVEDAERSWHEQEVIKTQTDIERQREARLRADREMREKQVEQLMAQAVQHRKDGDYDAAMAVLKQVTVIDPRYKPARWMLEDLDQIAAWRKHREVRNEFERQSQGALVTVDEAKIPWHVELLYPDNWPEITARRVPLGGRMPGSRIFAALDKPIRVDLAGEPLDAVLASLSKEHDLNIITNWKDLQHAGVDRKTPIEIYLPTEISLRRALTEVMEQAGAGVAEVGFDVRDDVVKIATRKTLDQEAYTVVYDINDLLMEIPHFADSPMRDLHESNAEIGLPAGAPVPHMWNEPGDDEEMLADPLRSSRLQQIIDLIQTTVAPGSWLDRGGSVGTIAEINGQLVITQNSASQSAIGDLLGKLREQRAIQIAVEARFVTVSSNYLEELGMDIDIILNNGNAGYDYVPGAGGPTVDPVTGSPLLMPRSLSRLGFTPAPPPGLGNPTTLNPAPVPQPFGQPAFVPQAGGASGSQVTPVPVRNSILSYTDPAVLGSDVPGSFAGSTLPPAFSLFGSFLDNIQVDFLIRATQADSRTTVLTAPQLVLFNGQRSWVAVTIQQNFVSTLQPQVAQGAVAQQPQIGTINSGAVLDVEATVTADRRYVTMTLRPAVTRLLDLQTIPFSGGAAGGGFGGGTALAAFVQLPTLSTQTVRTTVSVPDGGTLLIGGQKLASEQEVEAGVPVLSKIPLLKRAYSSRSMVKDEQILLMLIKPKILIQTEQEELAFPGFAAP